MGNNVIQVVNDVFAELDESHRIDLRDEAFEDTSYRMMDFMILLNYKHVDKLPTETLQERFMAGDHSVIYPFLNWMLHRVPELKKRAYLARYLRRLEIPTEILASDQSTNMLLVGTITISDENFGQASCPPTRS